MASASSVPDAANTISLAHRIAGSPRFKALFRDGMGLVEEVAAYLDGSGRDEAKRLPRPTAAAYAAESMRLTTRLMHIASWLLVQRAVIEGDMSPQQAASERHKVRLRAQEIATGPALFVHLPETLQDLTERSLRLQSRVLHLDEAIRTPDAVLATAQDRIASPIDEQRERIRVAFAGR